RSAARDAAEFLRDLFGGAPGNLHVLIWSLRDKRSRWLPVRQLGAAEQYLARFADPSAGDVYAGVSLSPKDWGPGKRCPAEQAAGIVGLWADIDIRGAAHKQPDLPETVEEARELIASVGLPATESVHSGHGLQSWWLLREPWIFCSDEERRHAQELVRRFQGLLRQRAAERGWTLDATHDLARVRRVPGTWNCKGEPVPVRILEKDGPRYAVGDFLALLPQPSDKVPVPHAANGIPVVERARKYVGRMPEAISGQRGH